MATIREILHDTKHRPFDFPSGKWTYYQEWNQVLFLHWKVPLHVLQPFVPDRLNIDTFDGDAYVSLVPFTMQKIRPRGIFALEFLSDFHEINLRTYVNHNNRQGVYFLNIEAQKALSVFVAKTLSGLLYEKSIIKRNRGVYFAKNATKNLFLDTEYEIDQPLLQKTALDRWLTERYCLYLNQEDAIYRYDIHHKEWEISNVKINRLMLNYPLGEANLSDQNPDYMHYSKGVQVVAWNKVRL